MSLREQAAADLTTIVEDTDGFGWPITVTAPDGTSADLVGLSSDIAQTIDPDTGQAVSGRHAHVFLRLSSLTTAGLGIPRGIADAGSDPWVVTFDDIDGTEHSFKVMEALPDRAIGGVVCLLEAYKT